MLAGVLALLTAAPSLAHAAPTCRVAIHGDVAFGGYDVFSPAARHATMRIRVDCPQSAAPQIAISRGNSPTFGARELRSGNDVLRYNLYVDPGHRIVWGDGTEGTRVHGAASGNAEVTVYGRISPGQDVSPGSYSDSLVVTVFF